MIADFIIFMVVVIALTIICMAANLISNIRQEKRNVLLRQQEKEYSPTVASPLVNGMYGGVFNIKNSFREELVKDGKDFTVILTCKTDDVDVHVSKNKKEWNYIGHLKNFEDSVELVVPTQKTLYVKAEKTNYLDSIPIKLIGTPKKKKKKPGKDDCSCDCKD